MQSNIPYLPKEESRHATGSNLIQNPVVLAGILGGVALLLLLALVNLSSYPVTWYDEGSHLHVPKTLVQRGVYADLSSDGYRYYGPTVGVGPTVMLPIAAVFKLFGIGLIQARLVIVVYLLATIATFFRFSDDLVGKRAAFVATALLVVTPGIALIEYGREVLGEVPGLFFMLAGLLLLFRNWDRGNWKPLVLSGILLGLATVTKNQYLLILVPTIGISWFINLIYYRLSPQRVFIIPGVILVGCYLIWQLILVFSLGPATAAENFKSLQVATSGAALVFSTDLMKSSLRELLSLKVFLGWLVPTLIYGGTLVLPRNRAAQKWSLLYILIAVNLIWYVIASVGWLRYAFPALAVASIFVARFFFDITDGYRFDFHVFMQGLHSGSSEVSTQSLRAVFVVWLVVMIVAPLAQVSIKVIFPPFNAPMAMASYMNEHVPEDVIVETWEPEMGFLTDHDYHYPPQLLLDTAIGYIWRNGPPPADKYNYLTTDKPGYVLVGEFSRWVNLYSTDILQKKYDEVKQIGSFTLYRLKDLP